MNDQRIQDWRISWYRGEVEREGLGSHMSRRDSKSAAGMRTFRRAGATAEAWNALLSPREMKYGEDKETHAD